MPPDASRRRGLTPCPPRADRRRRLGGLAALALARQGFGVASSSARRAGGIRRRPQLSPNATRVLARLGALAPPREVATAPQRIRVLRGARRRESGATPLEGAARAGARLILSIAPTCNAPSSRPRRDRQVGCSSAPSSSATAATRRPPRSASSAARVVPERGRRPLVGADGLRSKVRASSGSATPTRRVHRTASRFAPRWRPNCRAAPARRRGDAAARAARASRPISAARRLADQPCRRDRSNWRSARAHARRILGRRSRPPGA